MRVYTTEKISANLERTPEGFLLAKNVPIARIGTQKYHVSELPAPREGQWPQDEHGVVVIYRQAADVFRAETLASFNGKSIVNNHPDDPAGVNPANWQELSVGVVLDPRRGTGELADVLIADLLITQEQAIRDVLDGKREVSCGYDCDYVISDGRGLQQNIVGNHLALVEKGRCGARCSIGDSQGGFMKFVDKIRALLPTEKHSALDAMIKDAPADAMAALTRDEAPGSGVHIHMGAQPAMNDARKYSDAALDEQFGKIEKKFEEGGKASDARHQQVMDAIANLTPKEKEKEQDAKEIEGNLKEEAPPGTGDQAMKATDSMYLADSFQETASLAEIIAPGVALPTFDRASKPVDSFKSICALRKKALGLGSRDTATNAIITGLRGGRELTQDALDKMPCGETRGLFLAVGAMKKVANAAPVRDLGVPRPGTVQAPTIISPADVNKKNRDFYANAR